MCNLGEGIEEEAMAKGEARGIKIGETRGEARGLAEGINGLVDVKILQAKVLKIWKLHGLNLNMHSYTRHCNNS